MYKTVQTVEGSQDSTITGMVTDVTGSGIIWEINSGNTIYERCPITGRFYPKA